MEFYVYLLKNIWVTTSRRRRIDAAMIVSMMLTVGRVRFYEYITYFVQLIFFDILNENIYFYRLSQT